MSGLTVLLTVLKAFFFYLLLVSMFRFPISLIHSLWISFCIFLSYFPNLQLLPGTFSPYPPHFMFFFIYEKNKKTTATIKCAIQFKITKYEARHGLCVKSSVTSLVNWLPLSRQPHLQITSWIWLRAVPISSSHWGFVLLELVLILNMLFQSWH